jgi:hypothetical protein
MKFSDFSQSPKKLLTVSYFHPSLFSFARRVLILRVSVSTLHSVPGS